jgi:hypothetical protein
MKGPNKQKIKARKMKICPIISQNLKAPRLKSPNQIAIAGKTTSAKAVIEIEIIQEIRFT